MSRLGTMLYGDLGEVRGLLDTCDDASEVAAAVMNIIDHVKALESKVESLEKMAREQSAINNGMDVV